MLIKDFLLYNKKFKKSKQFNVWNKCWSIKYLHDIFVVVVNQVMTETDTEFSFDESGETILSKPYRINLSQL